VGTETKSAALDYTMAARPIITYATIVRGQELNYRPAELSPENCRRWPAWS